MTDTDRSPAHMHDQDFIWAYLVHLSYNMWSDRDVAELEPIHLSFKPYLRFNARVWRDVTSAMSQAGVTMVVIDLGDGVQYTSHPEIAVRHAWSTGQLQQELRILRDLGIEPIPKLNFSAAHDA